jgi:hypothetical protein
MAAQLDHHHRDTLEKLYAHPTSGNITWRTIRSLLESLEAIHEEPNGKFKVTLGGETEVLVAPRGKDVDKQLIVDLRRMLKAGGYGPGTREPPVDDRDGTLHGKNVVAAIAFHSSSIYATDAPPGEAPDHVRAADPLGRFHKVHHQAGNPEGTYEDDSPEYWRALTEALAPAAAILVLGHGQGKASAAHHWVEYVEQHDPAVAAKVVADVRVDLDHLDDEQVLRLAQEYFAGPARRDFGDSRRGELPGPS